MKVILYGSNGDSKWRDVVKNDLRVEYYDPAEKKPSFKEWKKLRDRSEYILFVVTPSDASDELFSNILEESKRSPKKILFYVADKTLTGNDKDRAQFSPITRARLEVLGETVSDAGGMNFVKYRSVVDFLNQEFNELI